MKRFSHMLCALLVISASPLLNACISVDFAALAASPDKEATAHLAGMFSARGKKVKDLLGVGGQVNLPALIGDEVFSSSDRVRIEYEPGVALTIVYFYGSQELGQRVMKAQDGLAINPDGTYTVKSFAGCKQHGNEPVAFCGNSSVRLFVNADGDLATIQTELQGGVVGILPLAGYVKKLVVFKRIPPPPASRYGPAPTSSAFLSGRKADTTHVAVAA